MQGSAYQMGKLEGQLEGKLKGELEGRLEGRLETLALLYGRQLQRPLTEAERGALAQRVGTLSVNRLLDVPMERSAKALGEWLGDPAAS